MYHTLVDVALLGTTQCYDTIEVALSDGTHEATGAAPGGETTAWVAVDGSGLSDGNLTVEARAFNAAGSSSPLDGTDAFKDATAPSLTVTEPEDGVVVELSTVTARGTCTDAHLQTFTVNGEATPRDGTGAFEKAVFLSGGAWGTTIDAVAEDEYRNVTTVTRTVEAAPLEVQITSPQDGQVLDATSVPVAGTVRGPRDAEVFVNGQRAERSGESFTLAGLTLTEGPNTLTAHAQTPGDAAQHTITVTRDTTNPAVTIEVPDSIDIFDALSVDVAGRVDDPTVLSVTVNGVEAHLYGSYFVAVAVPLNAEGSNAIIAEATDAAGHTGSGSVTVTRDTLPPELEITSPEDGTTVYHTPIPVSGTVWDATLYEVRVNGLKAVIADGTFTVAEVPLASNGPNAVVAVARDSVGRQTVRSITVNRELAPTVTVQDVVFSPHSTDAVVKVKVTGTVDHAAGICGRNEAHPFYKDGTRPVANQVSGTIEGTNFEIDGLAVWAGVNVLSVTAWDGPGETRVDVVVDLSASEGGYGDGQDAPYAILSVSAGGAAGEGGGGTLAGGESFMTFGALAASGGGPGLTVTDKGDETNVFVGTRLRFSVQASACGAEFVSTAISLGDKLMIVNNGNADPHAKKSNTVTKGDYVENGTTYTFGGFWWEAVATSAGSWGDVRATAVLVVNTDPPTDPPPTIDVDSNALSGNNDAVTGVSFEVPGSPYTGWVLKGGSGDSIQVLISKGAPGSVGVKATVTTAMGLLTDQVSWLRNGEFAGQGHELVWGLMTPDAAYDVVAFGDANGNKKPDTQAYESAITINVDAGYGKVLGGAPLQVPSDHFWCYVGTTVTAELVLKDFSSTAPLPQVQGWYLLPVDVPAGLSPLDILEVESGHNHSGSTTVTLNGISPGTVNLFVALLPPGAPFTTLPYCVPVMASATTVEAPPDDRPRFFVGKSVTLSGGEDHINQWEVTVGKDLGYTPTKSHQVTWDILVGALRKHSALYWLGDSNVGTWSEKPFSAILVYKDDRLKDDERQPVTPHSVSRGLGDAKYKLVFLNCCKSANTDDIGSKANEMSRTFGDDTAYVGWQTRVSIRDAMNAGKDFRDALNGKKTVDEAVAAARKGGASNLKALRGGNVVVDLTD